MASDNVPRYRDSIDRSAELMRLAVPLMSRQPTPQHPISYAVWYGYVSGRNGLLNDEIDALLRKQGHLTEENTLALYRQFVQTPDEAAANRINTTLQQAIADLSTSATRSEDSAARFSQQLEQFTELLGSSTDPAQLPYAIARIIGQNGEVALSTAKLLKVLTAVCVDLDRLRDELHCNREATVTDVLTGLRNRRGFEQALAELVESMQSDAAASEPFSLLLIDIDHFKRFNESFGDVVGDKVLGLVAHVLRDSVRGNDTVARTGGEEFALLLPKTSLAGAKRVGEIVCQNIGRGQVRTAGGEKIERVTASLGIGTWQAGETGEAFTRRVDAALSRSKNTGRDRVSLA